MTTITINKANRGSWIHALFSYLFSLELLNSKENAELVLFSIWSVFGMKSFGRHKSEQYDWELCPSLGGKKAHLLPHFSDVAVKRQKTHHLSQATSNLTGCLAVWNQHSCLQEEWRIPNVLPASIIFLVGKQHGSFRGNCSLSSNPCGGINRRLM